MEIDKFYIYLLLKYIYKIKKVCYNEKDMGNVNKITPKQRAFIHLFVKSNGRMTPTDCAKEAGYSEKSATNIACNLRSPKMFPLVVEAIENLQKEYAEASKIDFVRHARELARLRDTAVTNGQLGPAVNAEFRRGQLAGFYVDRKEVVTASLDNMTRPELEAKLKEIRDHNIINGEAIGVEVKEIEHNADHFQSKLKDKQVETKK